ncbi:MAG: 1-acyl-sn-glycerol-3-phosphate acyltransferase [Dysgonamonadaceae bacterium]|jgi:1-acyl-sn-glycerol-3-phosphate acyltransferase|nr:1-acyl-sn-glycerol-3-phosphate acyltransferase [Dysgonamonadaceae bacterium]
MKKILSFLLGLTGWKSVLNEAIPPKCVICVAPHTSNWDFILGILFYKTIGGSIRFLMKKEWFFFPMSMILKSLGGIPVDRTKKTFVSEQMASLFRSDEHCRLAITPEGTRKKSAKWKTGFYYIALAAGVPITLAYIDYAQKELGVIKNFYPTGNGEQDIEEIKQYYFHIRGKYPKKFTIEDE